MTERIVNVGPVVFQFRHEAPTGTAYQYFAVGLSHSEERRPQGLGFFRIRELERLPDETAHAPFGFFRERRRQRRSAGAFVGSGFPSSDDFAAASFAVNRKPEPRVEFFYGRFVSYRAFSEAFGVLRESSAHIPAFGVGDAVHVFFKRVPETAVSVTPIEHVFPEHRFSFVGNVSFEEPSPKSFAAQKSRFVAVTRRFLVERAEPETRAFRPRNQARFRYAGFVTARSARNESADFGEFDFRKGFRVPFEFDPEHS